MERCLNLIDQEALPPEQLERLESLTSRFARLADLLIQRIFRLVDEIELTGGGSILDRIYRAEKRGWANAAELIKIRELRNLISHEYATEKMLEIYAAVATLSPALLAAVPKVIAYARNTVQRYPAEPRASDRIQPHAWTMRRKVDDILGCYARRVAPAAADTDKQAWQEHLTGKYGGRGMKRFPCMTARGARP
jgi:hypothetical protein